MDKKKIIEKIRDDNFSLYHQEYLEWLSSPHTTPVDFNKDWVGTDSKEEFDKNLKKYSKWLQPFVNNPIRYNINKQNFRSKFDLLISSFTRTISKSYQFWKRVNN